MNKRSKSYTTFLLPLVTRYMLTNIRRIESFTVPLHSPDGGQIAWAPLELCKGLSVVSELRCNRAIF